jgi:hypothetical protein
MLTSVADASTEDLLNLTLHSTLMKMRSPLSVS